MEEMTFLTKEQVAKRWQVTSRTVERLVAEGNLLAYRFSKVGMRFKLTDLLAFEESRRCNPVTSTVQPARRGPKLKGAVVDFTDRQPRRKSA